MAKRLAVIPELCSGLRLCLPGRGAKDLPVHDLKGLTEEAEKTYAYMRNHKFFELWQREGLMNVMEYANAAGILPSYNFKDASFARIGQINGDTMLDSYKIGDSACFSCPMCCGNIFLVKHGKYIGTVVEGPEYETCAMTAGLAPPWPWPTPPATSAPITPELDHRQGDRAGSERAALRAFLQLRDRTTDNSLATAGSVLSEAGLGFRRYSRSRVGEAFFPVRPNQINFRRFSML
ncbi:MAG: hypothetical protein JSV89_08215 [Spirochaetaceae bacterium]|nr:MAG: hypothetical protein JSV89_08215 [Spirochaetaceae bacterium]